MLRRRPAMTLSLFPRARLRLPITKTVVTFTTVAVLLIASVIAARAESEKWTEIRSTHFNVVTDAGDKRGREVALHFEQIRAVFGHMINKDQVNFSVPLQIIGLRHGSDMKRFGGVYNGKAVQLAGFFQPGQDRDYVVLDLSAPNAWEAVLHEYAHALLNSNYPPSAPWFDEGFAEYVSTIEVSNKDVVHGKPPMGTMELLDSSKWLPIEYLFSIAHESKDYNEGDRRSIFYAESWLAFHYLYSMGKMAEVGEYMTLTMDQHQPVAESLQRAFGMDGKQFLLTLQRYEHSRSNLYHTVPLPLEVETANTYSSQSLPATDAQAMLADLQIHSPDHLNEGVAALQNLLQQAPKNAAVHRSLGFAYLRKQDYESASREFSRALELDNNDIWSHYYSALLAYRQAAGFNDAGGQEIANVEHDLDVAIRLNPQFADAFHLRGLAELANGDSRLALRDLSSAVTLSPRNTTYFSNLGQAYIAARMWVEARAVFHRLEQDPDPAIAQNASLQLSQIQQLEESKPLQAVMGRRAEDYTAPQWRPKTKEQEKETEIQGSESTSATTLPQPRPAEVKYVKGTLLTVDCSKKPAATFTITSVGKTWTISTDDFTHMILIGADEFSCDWHDRKVAVNFRPSGDGTGKLVSLEID